MCSKKTKPEAIHNHFKFRKLLIFPTIKPSNFFSIQTLVFFSIVSISLIFYIFFSLHHKIEAHYSTHRKTTISNDDDDEKTNITHILFGIGGSVKSWKDRQQYIKLQWKPNITRGFVWLDQKPYHNMTWPDTVPPYKVSEDTSRFKYSCAYGSRSAVRIARIVRELRVGVAKREVVRYWR